MINLSKDETFLAKWAAGEITPEQLAEFKKHPDYNRFVKINEAADSLSLERFDESTAFFNLKEKLEAKPRKKGKVISMYKWIGAVAASAVLAFGIYTTNFSSTIYTSDIAEHKNIALPDGSSMLLNASATAEINKNTWKRDREVQLSGEAYFNVTKGRKFSVKTSLGTIQVLGTQFTVNTLQNNLLVVKCFEGKVKVTTPSTEVILTKGMAFQVYEKEKLQWKFSASAPGWTTSINETTFKSIPVSHVITSLKRQYNVEVTNAEKLNKELLFTGSFSNTNLKEALQTVLGTLGVNYELVSENEIRILP